MRTLRFILLFFLLTSSVLLFSQLTGPQNIPGDYATISAAVTALNSAGVGAGGVFFNIAPGYAQTLTARINLTASGTASNPIVFQKAGAGINPLLTAYTGVSASAATPDGMWSLQGCDYVTIDGIDLYDPNTASSTEMMEYGYGLFVTSGTNGCQHNTIINCHITLNRFNTYNGSSMMENCSTGIISTYVTPTAANVAVSITAATGSNSYNGFFTNYIENCNNGISLVGNPAASPYTNADILNDIGGGESGTGNTIVNFGGSTSTAYVYGIRVRNQWSINISNNILDSNNGSGSNDENSSLYGIYTSGADNANAKIYYNDISLKTGSLESSIIGIYNTMGGGLQTSIVSINFNTIHDCYSSLTSSTQNSFYGIFNNANVGTLNVNFNTITNINLPGKYGITGIYAYGTMENFNCTYSVISNLVKTGPEGHVWGIIAFSAQNISITYNQIHDFSLPNLDSDIAINSIYGIHSSGETVSEVISNNTIYNFSMTGTTFYTSSMLGIGNADNGNTAARTISSNLIYNFYSYVSQLCIVSGIYQTMGGAEIFRNRVYNLSNDGYSGHSYGLYIYGSQNQKIYNNMIYDLKTLHSQTSHSCVGIYDVNTAPLDEISYNTVYLDSVGLYLDFSPAVLYCGTGNYSLKNNIFINRATPGFLGKAIVIWKASPDTTDFAPDTDHNIYYAGTPDPSHVIGYLGSNSYQTLADYKTVMTGRDQGSYTEDAPFISSSGTINVHLNSTVPTRAEGNAIPISYITTDYDGQARNTITPDIGADEGNFTPIIDPVEHGNLYGQVREALTYANLADVTVSINREVTQTDAGGQFQFLNIVAGNYQMVLHKAGYQDRYSTIEIPPNSNVSLYPLMDWSQAVPSMTFIDSGLTPGQTVSYGLTISNPGSWFLDWQTVCTAWGGDTFLSGSLNQNWEALNTTGWNYVFGPNTQFDSSDPGYNSARTFTFASLGSTTPQWLITPKMHVSVRDNFFTYYLKQLNTTNEYIELWVSTTTADTSAFSLFTSLGPFEDTNWGQYGTDLSSFNGSDIYIAFRYPKLDTVGAYMCIDNIEGPACYLPASNWLTTPTASGFIASGNQQTIGLQVSAAELLPGTYTAETWIQSNGKVSPVKVYVQLVVYVPAAGIPQNVSVAVLDAPQEIFQITWSASPNAQHYDVYASNDPMAPLSSFVHIRFTTDIFADVNPAILETAGLSDYPCFFRVTADNVLSRDGTEPVPLMGKKPRLEFIGDK